jgi:hypothetical protein
MIVFIIWHPEPVRKIICILSLLSLLLLLPTVGTKEDNVQVNVVDHAKSIERQCFLELIDVCTSNL